MLVNAQSTLAALVTERPSASRVLLRYGLDFCCGGHQSLEQACAARDLPLEEVSRALEQTPAASEAERWDRVPLPELVTYILDRFHAPLSEDLNQLCVMADKVLRVHGDTDPLRLGALAESVHALQDELLPHAMKEERVLFPWIIEGRMPRPEAPVQVMKHEHETAGALLERAAELTNGYSPPEGACNTWRTLYARLQEFDAELREHIHLENNILFPRALQG